MANEMRDRLVELLKTASYYLDEQDVLCNRIADHLIENGVIVLPIKVGDTVYTNINGIGLQNSFVISEVNLLGFGNGTYSWTWHQLGKSVFLTKSEAEQKLKEMRGK